MFPKKDNLEMPTDPFSKENQPSTDSVTSKDSSDPMGTRSYTSIRFMIAAPILIMLLVMFSGVVMIQYIEHEWHQNVVVGTDFQNIKTYLYLLTITTTIIAGIAGIGLSYVVVKPLQKITEVVRNASTGKIMQTEKITAHEEIGELQDSFNKMVKSLQIHVHERNKYILESMAGGLIALDIQGNVSIANATAQSILETNPQSIVGKSIFELIPDLPENQKIIRMFRKGLSEHLTYSSEEVYLTNKHSHEMPVGMTISLLKDKNNGLMGLVATFKELSKVKQIQQQLQRSDRLAAIGTLATGLAHEIRNPLGSMKGLTQLLEESLPLEDPKRRYTQIIIKEIDRLNRVVQELLTFSQSSEVGTELENINLLLKEAVFLAKQNALYRQTTHIFENYDPEIPPIRMERGKLVQTFLNMILNALEAVAAGDGTEEKVEIRTYISSSKPDYPVPNQGFTVIEMSNTGQPIPEDILNRIFDPFFTTKDFGTGLGLAIAHQIVASHSGHIEVSSIPGQMTVFRVYFPILPGTEVQKIDN